MTRTLLSEAEGYALLETYGIPVPRYALAATPEEAEAKATAIGFPLVAKIVSPQVVHKSDAGGVITGITSPEAAKKAFAAITANVRAAYPGAEIRGVILEAEQAQGLELIVGGKTDAAFGKVLTIGMGGTLVELLRDVAIRILPVDEDGILAMVRSLKGHPLIAGYRHAAPRDEAAFVRITGALVRMFLEHPEISEFDINPVILYGEGCCAVDARIYIDDTPEPAPVEGTGGPAPAGLLSGIRSVAVVGASQDPDKVGYAICRNMLPFSGDLYPVNPKSPTILGKTAYPSLTAIPGPVDAAVIAIPAQGVPGHCRRGRKERNPSRGHYLLRIPGNRRRRQSTRRADSYLGKKIPAPGHGPQLPRVHGPLAGNQHHVRHYFPPARFHCVYLPERCDHHDHCRLEPARRDRIFVGYLGGKPARPRIRGLSSRGPLPTRQQTAIILYVEEIKNGRRFLEIVRRITAAKPVIAIKSGSSAIGQKAASSHTGSLAGSYAVYQAAFQQAGIIPARSIREAFQAAELLASEGYPAGTRACRDLECRRLCRPLLGLRRALWDPARGVPKRDRAGTRRRPPVELEPGKPDRHGRAIRTRTGLQRPLMS